MAKPAARIAFLQATLALAAATIVVRSFMIQVVQHRQWAGKARAMRTDTRPIPARRGAIYDRNGVELAESQELYHVGVALKEVADTPVVHDRVMNALGLPRTAVDAAFHHGYAYFHGPFTAAQVENLRDLRGVHLESLYNRVYPMEALAAPLLGRFDPDSGRGVEGIEKEFDTLLAGHPGSERYALDAKGTRLEGPGQRLKDPVPGRDIYLTIDHDLQGIAEARLREGVEAHQAHGGAVVIYDLHTGELLAAAALHTDSASGKRAPSASTLVEPFEPGSTAKLFTAAAVLAGGSDTTPVDGHGGKWSMPIRGKHVRVIEDEHHLTGPVTLGMAVKYSSNIAMSEFSLRLDNTVQFKTLRDFGFGMVPGLGFPGESPGELALPANWANPTYSKPSLAQGYELQATPVQMAVAYGAIANHGFLLAPSLVREIRDTDGTVFWRNRADTVRRATTDAIAAQLMTYLALATDSGGTGSKAQLDRFTVIGKTGTAHELLNGAYVGGRYRASFAGIFPGDAPQWVVYVMIDRPSGADIFGGGVAAPMVHDILQEALALRHTRLDDRQLAQNTVALSEPRAPLEVAPTAIRRVAWPLHGPVAADTTREEVPVLTGVPVRDAVVDLQKLGFEVRLVGRGWVHGTDPAAGDSLMRGTTVTLRADTVQ
ncbi:MAG TPA: penicillin-binding transpeptidase domain-containing protein [Gemmatimonadales bacterium]|jgi:cell division protein FtsI (penicillin-binding protein 3)|nr:penicillin-binding transpeptidase domain-containing protein [Gemmatimonadales bacterium]